MAENKMYSNRVKNIPYSRGCLFACAYCTFGKMLKLSSCPDCKSFTPHVHPEALTKTPPKTKDGEFITIGLAGDISFIKPEEFLSVMEYCRKWSDRTFLIQSKSPAFFQEFFWDYEIPDNVILGTTIESNHWYVYLSDAPSPASRYDAMAALNCRKSVTIEPILKHSYSILVDWISNIKPEFVYVGYANDGCDGKKLRLPEPKLEETEELIFELEKFTEVRRKTIRKAWDEE